MAEDITKLSKRELMRLNAVAQVNLKLNSSAEHQNSKLDIATLLNEPLPEMPQFLGLKQREELFFYLQLLDEEKKRIRQEGLRKEESKLSEQIHAKSLEIRLRLGLVEIKRKTIDAKQQAGALSVEPLLISKPETPNKQKIKSDRIRQDNLTRAIHAAMQKLGKRKPSFDELWQYFQEDKDETGHIVDHNHDYIHWIDTKGKIHNTKITSLANRLAKIKL